MIAENVRTPDQVVIVGAGFAGLVTAYELHQRGIPSIVLERDQRAGGRIQSVELDGGARAEAHLEEFWESNPAVELLRRFGLPLVERSAQSSFIVDGEVHLVARNGRCPFVVNDSGRMREKSYAVEGGNARLVDELVRRLPCGTVQTGATVVRVVDDGAAVRVTYRVEPERECTVRGRYAVLTAPAWALRAIDIQPALGSLAQAAIMSTAAGGYVKVVAGLPIGAEHLWDRFDGRLFTLLSDSLAGCVHLRPAAEGPAPARRHVLTALVHGSRARSRFA